MAKKPINLILLQTDHHVWQTMLFCTKMFPNFSAGIPVTHLSWLAGVGNALNAEAAGVGGGGWPGVRWAPPQQQQGPRGDPRPGGARPWRPVYLWRKPPLLCWQYFISFWQEPPKCSEGCDHLPLSTYSALEHSVHCCVHIISLDFPSKVKIFEARCFIQI